MEFCGIQAISRASVQQLAITREIFIVASMQGVMAAFGLAMILVAVVVPHGCRAKFQSK